MQPIRLGLLIGVMTLFLIGCSTSQENNSSKPTIYTTIYPIEYAIERIGGEHIEVQSIFPPGVDAHSYEPTSREVTTIAESNAFIYMGAGMEGAAETIADALGEESAELIELGSHEELFHSNEGTEHEDEAEHNPDDHDGHSHGDHDPHVWIDPQRMIVLSELVKDELVRLYPEQEEEFETNFIELEKDLETLDESFQDVLADKDNKHLLVSHAAFGYWEERYGIEQIAINGLSTNSGPSQREITRIIDLAEEYQLDYVVYEQNTSDRVSEIIQNDIGAESIMIHNLAILTEEDIENNEDYLSLMEYNLEVLDTVFE